mgnify:CR=1 FL=1
MTISYDSKFNVAYIRLQNESTGVRTVCVSDDLNIDIAADGTVYGIELLNANEQLWAEGLGRFVFTDETIGDRREISVQ